MRHQRSILTLLTACMFILNGAAFGHAQEQVLGQDAHFRQVKNADGKMRLDVSSHPLHYQDERGEWRPIDLTLKPDISVRGFTHSVKQNRYQAYVADRGDAKIRMATPQGSVTYTVVVRGGTRPLGTVTGNRVLYFEILNGVDLKYTVESDLIKQEIILKNPSTSSRYSFLLDAPGLEPVKQTDGSIHLRNPSGETVFVLPRPFMHDSAPTRTYGDAWFELKQVGPKLYIDVVADANWLASPDRVYPVVIDPTTTVSVGNGQNQYFDVWFPQTITYSWSVYGHQSLFTYDYGHFHIYAPSGALVVDKHIGGNNGSSGTETYAVSASQLGQWRIEAYGTNQYSSGSGSVTYSTLFPVTTLRGTAGTNAITWNWTDTNVDEDGYQILDAAGNVKATLPANTTSWTETGLPDEGMLYTRLVAPQRSNYPGPKVTASQYTLPLSTTRIDDDTEWNRGTISPAGNIAVSSGSLKLTTYTSTTTNTFVDDFESGSLSGYSYSGWNVGNVYGPPYNGAYYAYAQAGYLELSTSNTTSIEFQGERQDDASTYARFYIDGVSQSCVGGNMVWERCAFNVPKGSHTFRWHHIFDEASAGSGGGSTPYGYYKIDALRITYENSWTRYQASGTWTYVIDGGATTKWLSKNLASTVPSGTSINVEFASSNDNVTYSGWTTNLAHDATSGTVPDGRYLKVRITLNSDPNGNATPTVDSLTITGTRNTTGPWVKPPTSDRPSPNEYRAPTWQWEAATSPAGTAIQKYAVRVAYESGVVYWSGETPDGLTRNLRTLLPETTAQANYSVQVRATDVNNVVGGWSPALQYVAKADTTAPSPPTPSTTSPTSDPQPVWSWSKASDPAGIKTYFISLGKTAGAQDVLPETEATPGMLPDAQNTPVQWASPYLAAGTYYAQVKVKDLAGNVSAYGSSGMVEINSTTTTTDVANGLSTSTGPSSQYNVDQNAPFAAYLKNTVEHINPSNGILSYKKTDMVLPGKGGFDLVIDRVYFANMAAAYRMRATIDANGAVQTALGTNTYLDSLYGIGVGWGFAFPSIELVSENNGSTTETRKYLHMGNGTVYRLVKDADVQAGQTNIDGYTLKDLTYAADTGYSRTWTDGSVHQSTHSVTTKDQRKFYFGNVAVGNPTPGLLAMADRHGQRIHFEYTTGEGVPVPRIKRIIDTVGRTVTFTYGTNTVTLAYGDKLITYNLVTVSGKQTLDNVVEKVDGTKNLTTTYSYNVDPTGAKFSFTSRDLASPTDKQTNFFYNLQRVTFPSGGYAHYTYAKAVKNLGTLGVMEYYRITSRKDAYVQGATITYNEKTFTYSGDGPDGYPTYSDVNQAPDTWTYWTKITDARGLTQTLTWDRQHLLKTDEKLYNGAQYPYYRQVTSTEYENLDTKLPTKQTVTKYKSATSAGVSTSTYTFYDQGKYGDVVAQAGPLGTLSFYEYDSKYHFAKHAETRQSYDPTTKQSKMLVGVFAINATTGNVDQKSAYLKQVTGNTTNTITGPNSGSLLYYGTTWQWMAPGMVSQVSFTVNHRAYAFSQAIAFDVQYRKIGDPGWTYVASRYYQAGWFTDNIGDENFTITFPEPGIYEFGVKLTKADGYCEISVFNIQATETYQYLEGPETTRYTYSPDGVNLTKQEILNPDNTVYQSRQIEYALNNGPNPNESMVQGGVTGENFDGAYPTKQWTSVTRKNANTPGSVDSWTQYDRYGRKIGAYDSAGRKTDYAYDLVDRLVTETYPQVTGETQRYSKTYLFDEANSKTTITDELSHQTQYTFDPVGHLLNVQRTNGAAWVTVQSATYDAMGLKLSDTDGNLNTTQYQYDAIGRNTKATYADSSTRWKSIAYDDEARSQEVTNTRQNKTKQVFDALGRLIQVDQHPDMTAPATTISTLYQYDAAGNMTKLTDPRGKVTTYTYGLGNRLKTVTYPSPLTGISYEYDPAGNLKKKIQSKILQYSYDEAGRLWKKMDNANNTLVEYTYDWASKVKDVTTPSSPNTKVSYVYDERGRVKQESVLVGVTTNSLAYTYDPRNLTQIAYPGGITVKYEYDDLDRVWSIPGYAGTEKAVQPPAQAVQGVEYDNAGNLKKITYANGVVTNITPDVRNRMDIMTVTLGETNLLKLDYTYDGEGNVSNLLTTADGQPTFTDSFGYDGLERLTSFTFNGTITTYGYDNAGNRTARNGTAIWTYNDANQLTAISGVTVTHDGSGNMTQKPSAAGTYAFTYDDEDRLLTATKAGSTVETNVYDGLGRRVKRTEGTTETLYLYRGNDVAATISSGVTTAHIRLDGRLFASHDSAGTRLYYHPDHLGSNRLVTTASGTVQGRLSYLPYGEERSSSGTPGEPRFTGKPQDTSTALQYYGVRYYDPELGRFITLDPARDGLNWYVYVGNNPLMYIDSNGKWRTSVVDGEAALILEYEANGAVENPYKVINEFDPSLLPVTQEIFNHTRKSNEDFNLASVKAGDALLIPNKYVPNVTDKLNGIIADAAAEASQHADDGLPRYRWFYDQVKTKGPWDLKSQPDWKTNHFVYEDMVIDRDAPGNILYGYAGSATRISPWKLHAAAGGYQIKSGTASRNWWYSYFDDPRDQGYIQMGIEMYDNE